MEQVSTFLKLVSLGNNIDRLVEERDIAVKCCARLSAAFEQVDDERRTLELALGFYSDPKSYEHIEAFPYPTCAIYLDQGATAQIALRGEAL
jgi:hypothetical protein